MTQKFTLHTHTVGFDGRDSVQGMVNRARELGFDTIGISNHFIVHPDIKDAKMYSYAVRGGYSNIYASSFEEALSRFAPHYEEVVRVQEANPDMRILRGMEVDFFGDIKWRKGFRNVINVLNPDYLIGAAHFVSLGGKILNMHDVKKLEAKQQDTMVMEYWLNVARAAESGLFDWMAHLDLPKRVGLGREPKWEEAEHWAIQTMAKSNTALEINTSFYKPDCYEPYPSNRILQMAAKNNVPVLLSDDAHNVKDMGRHFDEAGQLIQDFRLRKFNCR